MSKCNIKSYIFILIIFVILLITGFNTHNRTNIIYIRYTVQQGDTIWNIAKQYNTYKDIRETVYEIKKINNNDDSIIHAGDILLIPVRQ